MKQKSRSAAEVSAYLDGRLDHSDQVAFDARMAQDPALRRRVDEMRQVIDMVRAVPLRDPPRNYLLSPSMVTETKRQSARRRAPLFMMRMATSLVAIAFVITFGLGLLRSGMTPAMVTQSREIPQAAMLREDAADEFIAVPAELEQVAEAAPMKAVEAEGMSPTPEAEGTVEPPPEMALAPVLEPDSPQDAAEEPDVVGMGGGGEVTPEGEAEALEMAAAPPSPKEDADPTAWVEEPAEEIPTETATAAHEETLDDPQVAERSVAPEVESLGAVMEAETVAVSPETETSVQEETVTESRSSPVLWLAVGLGVATAVMAAVTFWLSRRTLG